MVILLGTVLRVAARQAPTAAPAAEPPVLSTVPSPQPGMSPQPVQMSGLPLQVGDLPPGVVVVRVIRGSFQNNLAGQDVRLHPGEAGEPRRAVTGADGRARFDGLTIGSQVYVRALVGAETLESQPFVIPSQAGVRVVLAAGVGATTSAAWPVAAAGEAVPAVASVPAADPDPLPGTSEWPRLVILAAVFIVGGTVFASLGMPRGRARAASPHVTAAANASPPPAPRREPPSSSADVVRLRTARSALFEQLVALEREPATGPLPAGDRRARHDALVHEIAALDVQIDDCRTID